MVRISTGQSQVLIKELEGVGQCQKYTDGDRRHYHRKLYLPEGLPPGSSIDLCCLDQIIRYILKSCNIDDHHVTNLLPAHEDDQSPVTCTGIQCQKRFSNNGKHTVDQNLPDISKYDSTDQVWHEKDGSENIGSF